MFPCSLNDSQWYEKTAMNVIETHEMKNGKYLYIMHISLSMPCEVLMNCSPVHYKYYVDAELSKKWEWLPRVGLFRGNYTHRGLNIPADVIRQTGEWNQYDGVSFPVAESGIRAHLHWFKNFWTGDDENSMISYEIKYSFRYFLPEWECLYNKEDNVQKIIDTFIVTIIKLGIQCLNFAKLNQIDDGNRILKELLEDHYVGPILAFLSESVGDSTNNDGQGSLRLASALVVISLVVVYKIPLQSDSFSLLCDSLLLRLDSNQSKCSELQMLMDRYIANQGEKVTNYLQLFIENSISSYLPQVEDLLLIVPLFHLLRGMSKPSTIPLCRKHESKEWWGLEGITLLPEKLKPRSEKFVKNIGDYRDKILPLFKLDALFPRTIVACMCFNAMPVIAATGLFPPDVLAANLHYFLKNERESGIHEQTNKAAEIFAEIRNQLYLMYSQDLESLPYLSSSAGIQQTIEIVLELVKTFLRYNRYQKLKYEFCFIASLAAAVLAVNLLAKYPNTQDSVQSLQVIEDVLASLLLSANKWLSESLPNVSFVYNVTDKDFNKALEEIKLFDSLLKLPFKGESIMTRWHQSMMSFLMSRIKSYLTMKRRFLHGEKPCFDITPIEVLKETPPIEVKPMIKLEFFCKVSLSEFDNSLQEYFSQTALTEIERVSEDPNADLSFLFGHGCNTQKVQNLICRLVDHVWPKEDNNEASKCPLTLLKQLLTHKSFALCINTFSNAAEGRNKNREYIDKYIEMVGIAFSVFEHCTKAFMEGSIELQYLHLLLLHKKAFIEACDIFKSRLTLTRTRQQSEGLKNVLLALLDEREKEILYLDQCIEWAQSFLALCKNVEKANLSELVDFVEKDYSKYSLSDCVTVGNSSNIVADRMIHLLNCSVSNVIISSLPQIGMLASSVLFKHLCWDHVCVQVNQDSINDVDIEFYSADEIFGKVWKPALKIWQTLCQQIEEEAITFDRLDKVISICGDSLEVLSRELHVMLRSESLINTRQDQIKEYITLENYSKSANVLNKARLALKLEGDFDALMLLTSAKTDKKRRLKDLNRTMLKAGKELATITQEQLKTIEKFIECEPLVSWLRSSVSDSKEVKVLVDLAMISAEGQGDIEVARVSFLHAAVMGYSPLIYELEKECGFQKFLQHCKAVWRALAVDPDLPTKLYDTNRALEWVKNVKESHGSVELNALRQAETINACGQYFVGCIDKKKWMVTLSIDDVILLKLKQEKVANKHRKLGDEEGREFSLLQLTDLQSKLMLVAGQAQQGKEDVTRFVEILDGVKRLANLYTRMCSTGNVLFQSWRASFDCNKAAKVSATVDFGLADKLLKSDMTDVRLQIREVCEFFEKSLDDWLQYVNKKRVMFTNLNYFTTEQLVILRHELAKLADKGNPDDKTFHLLQFVKPGCSEVDLKRAWQQTYKDLIEEQRAQEASNKDVSMETDASGLQLTSNEQLEKYQELLTYDFSEKLVTRALQITSYDFDRALQWCMENADEFVERECDQKDLEEMEEEHDDGDEMEFETLTAFTQNLLSRNDQPSSSLKSTLAELWNNYLNSITISVKDYISVHHLGVLLNNLMTPANTLPRPLPVYLEPNVPNLIVCSQAEMFSILLGIYMNEPNLPLPKADEVLLCMESTSIEEVELLWRRATSDGNNSKIYCLVNADNLSYDVAEKAEEKLESLVHAGYNLVIMCSKENEDKAHLVTVFDKHRIANPIVPPLQDLKDYLEYHFTIRDNIIKPAAVVDPNRLSVRVVNSWRAGVGKTLFVNKKYKLLQSVDPNSSCIGIQLQEVTVNTSGVLDTLLSNVLPPISATPRIFHIDIAQVAENGVDYLLFNLLILGSLTDRRGYVWQKSHYDLYLVENLPLLTQPLIGNGKMNVSPFVHHIINVLPSLTCWSPRDCLDLARNHFDAVELRHPFAVHSIHDQVMDEDVFHSACCQRPYQYLQLYLDKKDVKINADTVHGTPNNCIRCIMTYCGIKDPSWFELQHFLNFLNAQLCSCEHSVFCSAVTAEDLPGFMTFIVSFMIQMSRDFATRSLKIAEETPGLSNTNKFNYRDVELANFQLKRLWETRLRCKHHYSIGTIVTVKRANKSHPHPYVFFNEDQTSLTFLGFFIDPVSGNAIDPKTKQVIIPNAMSRQLQEGLVRNRVPLYEIFDALPRLEKIKKLCSVMGIENVYDPDPTYELTTDNVKKILAIFMRFRCQIPVIVMGETGCGKTRLIKFLCDLQKPPGATKDNMILMKVHGGTTQSDIVQKVQKASQVAAEITEEYGPSVCTVLFFDEANTTEAIGLIKEIMTDKTILGRPLPNLNGLKIIAACNPYRKHTDEMIDRLEHAGLGYHVQAEETRDKLGRIPMRHLVYRVQSLPQSLRPLVWDFGQLSTDVEELYIRQMVSRYVEEGKIPNVPGIAIAISLVLVSSQNFMRLQQDECSFVSLRDVLRVLDVMTWFLNHSKPLFRLMDEKISDMINNGNYFAKNENFKSDGNTRENNLNTLTVRHATRALILALGVCYHACLEQRKEYRDKIARCFKHPLVLQNGSETVFQEIDVCQDVFLDQVQLGENIARNQALKENVFMMVVCIELRIPLFLVGKPGSSKSLAKTIVADAMQREAAHKELFRGFKLAHMMSYQCSPLSTPEGIVGIFKQCAKLQEGKDLNNFVSIVVLDEIGLAEDSPKMPLKTLHPLLEDGCEGDEEPAPHKKVAFIGISNWALDPAKMNRGILVQRCVPDEKELIDSAKGICGNKQNELILIQNLLEPLAKGYLELYNLSKQKIREFFGLRDFYSLIKMVFALAKQQKTAPAFNRLVYAIRRNFGGLTDIDPVKVFSSHLNMTSKAARYADDSPSELIEKCLFGDSLFIQSRYLLVLTENYAALTILDKYIPRMKNCQVIFGSSFPKDQEYTQVCRNINRIKVCMEMGHSVVLLDLEKLYESLYDAMNQYYVSLGGQKFVDLGLGTHRVKCRVHSDFRMIVVAEKQVVYSKFPIPLINRLEKHFLAMNTMLTEKQKDIARQLDDWVNMFTKIDMMQLNNRREKLVKVGDIFIGYHADSAASVVLRVCHDLSENGSTEYDNVEVLNKGKKILLQCATPESILRLPHTPLRAEADAITEIYFNEQTHSCLEQFLQKHLSSKIKGCGLFAQITTHARLLSKDDMHKLRLPKDNLIFLHSIDTEQQLCREIEEFVDKLCKRQKAKGTESHCQAVMIFQCDSGNKYQNLIACTSYNILNEFSRVSDRLQALNITVNVMLIIHLPRVSGGCFIGFQGGYWLSYHLDDLMFPAKLQLSIEGLYRYSTISKLFANGLADNENLFLNEEQYIDAKANNEPEMMDSDSYIQDAADEDMDPAAHQISLNYSSKIVAILETVPTSSYVYRVGQIRPGLDKCFYDNLKTEQQTRDTDALVLCCIHSSLSMVKYANAAIEVKTCKIKTLQTLLKPEATSQDKLTLMSVFKARIYQLLAEKEHGASGLTVANVWLSREAASVDAVNKMGTFRRAVQNYLESKIAPLMAGIIAMADSENNLDLLVEHENCEHFIHQMWLKILLDPHVSHLRYSDLQTAIHRAELTEVTVKKYAAGESFYCRLPFSWIIKQHVDEIINSVTKMPDLDFADPSAIEMQATLIFKESKLGKILKAAEERSSSIILYKLYLHDFVRMIYKASSAECENEYKIVEDILTLACKTDNKTLIGLHLAFEKNKSMILNVSYGLQKWPEGLAAVSDFATKKSNEPINNELFDIRLLWCLLQHLSPARDYIDNVDKRQAWLHLVEYHQPTVQRLLAFIESTVANSLQTSSRASLFVMCRSLWTKICTLQLYIQYLCLANGNESLADLKMCWPLWITLKEPVNFKTSQSLDAVETFLRQRHTNVSKKIFGERKDCTVCNEPDTQLLPCGHSACQFCLERIGNNSNCPECRTVVPAEFTKGDVQTDAMIEARKKYKTYKDQCNVFFMDLLSQFCFANGQPPENTVIYKLLNYITCKSKDERASLSTRQMTVVGGAIDATPTVRSFLLQLLLRYSYTDVKDHFHTFFEQARLAISDKNELIELCIMCVYCLEDYYSSQYCVWSFENMASLQRTLSSVCHRNFTEGKFGLNKLEDITMLRLSAVLVIKWMIAIFIEKQNLPASEKNLKMTLINLVQKICSKNDIQWFRIYLIKMINYQYGIDGLRTLSQCEGAGWILPVGMNNGGDPAWQDFFVVYSTEYKDIRDKLETATIDGNFTPVQELLQTIKTDANLKIILLLLSLYQTVAVASVRHEVTRRQIEKVQPSLENFYNQYLPYNYKGLYLRLMKNTLVTRCCPRLVIRKEMNGIDKKLADILAHLVTIVCTTNNSVLLRTLHMFIVKPHLLAKSYLPTMPQDRLTDIWNVLKASALASNDAHKECIIYLCPKGHPYFIGDCGRATNASRCVECGALIGGVGYDKPAEGNVKLNESEDKTKAGHCLGPAAQRVLEVQEERELTRVSVCLLRLILHASMLLGAETNSNAIQQMIDPPIASVQVGNFLADHLRKDLQSLAKVCNCSPDNAVLLVHSILQNMSSKSVNDDSLDATLSTKAARQKWETVFQQIYLQPFVQALDATIGQALQHVANDKRLYESPLTRLLFEPESQQVPEQIDEIHNCQAMWRIKEKISLENLRQKLCNENTKQLNIPPEQCPLAVLNLFLQEEYLLQGLYYLPSVIRLQQIIAKNFYKRLDIAEANSMTIENMIENVQGLARKELEELAHDFLKVWNIVRLKLHSFVVGDRFKIPQEYCDKEMTLQSSLACLLPGVRGENICSLGLVHFLARVQNDLLEKYSMVKKSPLGEPVLVYDMTSANLINFREEEDLMPLILANCNYSFSVGQSVSMEYDFINLQKQIEERFIRGRSRLIPKIEIFSFKEDFTNAEVFLELNKRIPQEPLHSKMQLEIQNDLHYLPAISDMLGNLDIAIGFLISVGGSPKMLLLDFMKQKLHMKINVFTTKIRQCQLCHVRSLWLILSHTRAVMMCKNGQDPFTTVDEIYCKELSDVMSEELKAALKHVNLDLFMIMLYACIMFNITVLQRRGTDDYTDNTHYPLGAILNELASVEGYDPIPALGDNGQFPNSILAEHCIAVWLTVAKWHINTSG